MLQTLEECPVCKSTNLSLDFVGKCDRREDGRDWRIDRCKDCTLGFLNPQPDWAELAPYYNAMYDAYTSEHGIDSLTAEIERAKASGEFRHIRINEGLRILDVGCGGGAFLRVAHALGAEVYGVEPSEHGVATARAAGLPVFHGKLHNFLNSAEHSSRRFDVVTSNHVIEHHPDPVELLKQMKSLLAPNGYIWFGVPNTASKTASALKERWHSVDIPYHLMQFTPGSVKEAVNRADLKIRRHYTYSLPSATLASLCDIWRYKYFAPRKITQKLPFLKYVAEREARHMDEAGIGEAIIIEAEAA